MLTEYRDMADAAMSRLFGDEMPETPISIAALGRASQAIIDAPDLKTAQAAVIDILAQALEKMELERADLLAALQVLAEGWMQRNHPDSPGVTITDSQMADAAYAGRAAIEKATKT